MIINPIKLVTVHFIDGSNYQVENSFEELTTILKADNNLTVDLNLPNGQKIVAMKNTISRIISA